MTANPVEKERYTAEDLLLMPDDGRQYELINGEIVAVGTSNQQHSTLGMWLGFMLMAHIRATKLGGRVNGPDGTYQLDALNVKAPDVSYLTAENVAKIPKGAVYCPFGPDFVIEIKSPSDSRPYMKWLAELYIRTGTQLVWTIDIVEKTAIVYRAGGDTAIKYNGNGTLDASDVIPGFKIDMAEMFAEIENI